MASSSPNKRSESEAALWENSPKRRKTEEGKKPEDFYFLKLLTRVLKTIISQKKVEEEDIGSAIQSIKEAFIGNTFLSVDLTKWDYSCAYLFRYGSHGAALTYHKVLDALKNCGDLASKLKQSDLNIISLGGGPGNDVIGFCSALYETQVPDRLNITVVDSVREWSIYVDLVKKFIREGSYGNVSDLFQQRDPTLSFICAKLPGIPNKDKEYFRALKKADIVLMTKIVSILDWDDKRVIVQSIYENMKKGSLLLFIDSPFRDELWSDFEIMYLSEQTEEKFFSSVTTDGFYSDNNVGSIARIAVLRKK